MPPCHDPSKLSTGERGILVMAQGPDVVIDNRIALAVGIAAAVAFVVWFVWYMVRTRRLYTGNSHLLKVGVPSSATVLEAATTRMSVQWGESMYGAGRRVYGYRLRVEPDGGVPYEVRLKAVAHATVGQRVRVYVDPRHPDRVAFGEPSERAYEDAEMARLNRLSAKTEGADPVAGAQPLAAKGDAADEIAKLVDLRDRGVLTEVEFQMQKKKVLRA